jgi:DedD protein
MEVRVRERLIGALVLVAVVVLIVPAVLTGRGEKATVDAPGQPTRRVEMPIEDEARKPEEQVLVPEPVADDEVTSAVARPARKAPEEPRPSASAKPPEAPPKAESAPPAKPAATPPRSPAPPAAAMQSAAWAVQLGAFSNRTKAEQLVEQLRERRYAAFMLEYRASGQVLYRVRVGPEQDRARAQQIAARLAKDGFQPVVARHP